MQLKLKYYTERDIRLLFLRRTNAALSPSTHQMLLGNTLIWGRPGKFWVKEWQEGQEMAHFIGHYYLLAVIIYFTVSEPGRGKRCGMSPNCWRHNNPKPGVLLSINCWKSCAMLGKKNVKRQKTPYWVKPAVHSVSHQ